MTMGGFIDGLTFGARNIVDWPPLKILPLCLEKHEFCHILAVGTLMAMSQFGQGHCSPIYSLLDTL